MKLTIEPYLESRYLGCFKSPVYRAGVLINGRPFIDAALYGDPNGRVLNRQKEVLAELTRRVEEFAAAEAIKLGLEPNRK